MDKHLVYFCIFYNADYFKLFSLLLTSLKFYSATEPFDFLVITSPDFVGKVDELSRRFGIPLKTMTMECTTIFQAACARLFIFDYSLIHMYTKILYLDTDILIKGDLQCIFDIPLDDVLYGLESGTTASPNFGAQFFVPMAPMVPMAPKTGINSGTLLFNNSSSIETLFLNIQAHIVSYTDSGATPPCCMDQPFINYHAIKDGLYNNTRLISLVELFEDSDTPPNMDSAILCHFSFPIGNVAHKYARMTRFLKACLLQNSNRIPSHVNIIGQSFSWNAGYIRFTTSGLETTWGNGGYESLDAHRLLVYWNNHYHVLKFKTDWSGFVGVRTWPLDFEIVDGLNMA